ncbi:hypothetical protein HDU97_000375 [Phlyctochytrium planicorne]|nr:hypothetical protein HDU97_000375 [Phlyctochytrium planicorne]
MPKRQSYEVLEAILSNMMAVDTTSSPASPSHSKSSSHSRSPCSSPTQRNTVAKGRSFSDALSFALVCRAWSTPALVMLYRQPTDLLLNNGDDESTQHRRMQSFIQTLSIPSSITFAPYRQMIRFLDLSSLGPSSCSSHLTSNANSDNLESTSPSDLYPELLHVLIGQRTDSWEGSGSQNDGMDVVSNSSSWPLIKRNPTLHHQQLTLRGLRLPALSGHVDLESLLLLAQRLNLVELRIDGEGSPSFGRRALSHLATLSLCATDEGGKFENSAMTACELNADTTFGQEVAKRLLETKANEDIVIAEDVRTISMPPSPPASPCHSPISPDNDHMRLPFCPLTMAMTRELDTRTTPSKESRGRTVEEITPSTSMTNLFQLESLNSPIATIERLSWAAVIPRDNTEDFQKLSLCLSRLHSLRKIKLPEIPAGSGILKALSGLPYLSAIECKWLEEDIGELSFSPTDTGSHHVSPPASPSRMRRTSHFSPNMLTDTISNLHVHTRRSLALKSLICISRASSTSPGSRWTQASFRKFIESSPHLETLRLPGLKQLVNDDLSFLACQPCAASIVDLELPLVAAVPKKNVISYVKSPAPAVADGLVDVIVACKNLRSVRAWFVSEVVGKVWKMNADRRKKMKESGAGVRRGEECEVVFGDKAPSFIFGYEAIEDLRNVLLMMRAKEDAMSFSSSHYASSPTYNTTSVRKRRLDLESEDAADVAASKRIHVASLPAVAGQQAVEPSTFHQQQQQQNGGTAWTVASPAEPVGLDGRSSFTFGRPSGASSSSTSSYMLSGGSPVRTTSRTAPFERLFSPLRGSRKRGGELFDVDAGEEEDGGLRGSGFIKKLRMMDQGRSLSSASGTVSSTSSQGMDAGILSFDGGISNNATTSEPSRANQMFQDIDADLDAIDITDSLRPVRLDSKTGALVPVSTSTNSVAPQSSTPSSTSFSLIRPQPSNSGATDLEFSYTHLLPALTPSLGLRSELPEVMYPDGRGQVILWKSGRPWGPFSTCEVPDSKREVEDAGDRIVEVFGGEGDEDGQRIVGNFGDNVDMMDMD